MDGMNASLQADIARTAKDHAYDMAGKRFGKLIVANELPVMKNEHNYYLCQCDCGGSRLVRYSDLVSGRITNCGCEGRKKKSLSSRRFGYLTALWSTERRSPNGSVIWHCRCDCGNEVDVPREQLVAKKRISCGCRQIYSQERIGDLLNLNYVDETCIERLKNCERKSGNKSNRRGVYLRKNGQYYAIIGLKGKRYYLGTYSDLASAVDARQKAEQALYTTVLEDYEKWKKKKETDASWGV